MNAIEQARVDIVTVVMAAQAAWTAYPLTVEYGNREVVDQNLQTKPYLKVKILPLSASQLDMADKPHVKQLGQIQLIAVAKEGSGESEANQLLDFLTPYFDMKAFSLVNCYAVEAQTPRTISGWEYCPAIVNYWYNRTS